MRPTWHLGAVVLAAASQAAAQADALPGVTDVNELSLADLLDAQIDVASKKPQTTRETPGIVTVITREEIVASGARDLLDLLVMVPGFAPGVDVEGVVDLGVRGQWAHEGKMLLLIDGQPMNELLYSTLQLGNHYPVEAIQRIEVIRGPGSAIYGGYAELAVINIITRDASELHGVSVSAHYGQTGRAIGEANLSLTFADTAKSGVSLSGALALGRGTRATDMYRDFTGGSYSMDGSRRSIRCSPTSGSSTASSGCAASSTATTCRRATAPARWSRAPPSRASAATTPTRSTTSCCAITSC